MWSAHFLFNNDTSHTEIHMIRRNAVYHDFSLS